MMLKLLKQDWAADKLVAAFEALKISPQERAEKLNLEQFVALTKSLAKQSEINETEKTHLHFNGSTCIGSMRNWYLPIACGSSLAIFNRTHDEAFLGATFGMSPQEVQRVLKKQSALLLTYGEYQKTETLPLIEHNIFFEPLFSEDKIKESYLYMPSIQMYESVVEAEFTFREDRLSYVAVYFDPVNPAKSQAVIESVENNLKSFCQLSSREDSKDVPGAYTVHFTSPSSKPSLWVNLTDKRPIIILNLLNPKTESDKQQQILMRSRQPSD